MGERAKPHTAAGFRKRLALVVVASFSLAAAVAIGYFALSTYQAVPFGSGRMLLSRLQASPGEGEGFGFRTIRMGADLELAFDAGGTRYSCLFDTFTYKYTYTPPTIGPEQAKWPTRKVADSELAKRLRFKPLSPKKASGFKLGDHELNWVDLNPSNSAPTYNGVTLTPQNYHPSQALCSKVYLRGEVQGYLIQSPTAPALGTHQNMMAIVGQGYFTVDSGVGTTRAIGAANGVDYVILTRTLTPGQRQLLREALGDNDH